MDLLNILASFVILSYANSMQTAPEYIQATNTPSPTVTVQIIETPTPTPSPIPEPTATPGPTPIAKPNLEINSKYKLLKFKSKGERVGALQEQLKKYGYYSGEIDYKYGWKTVEAVRIFQKLHSLTADGVAGKETQTILFESKNIVKLPTQVDVITIPLYSPTVSPTDYAKK